MTGLSVFILILGVVWLLVLLAMYVDHRRKMQRIEAVEDRLDQGAAEAETRRKARPTPFRLIPFGSKIETQHDYVNDCLLVTVTLPDGTFEHHAIGPDDTDSLLDLKIREKFLMRDALARQKGLNVDGTVRRETVAPAPYYPPPRGVLSHNDLTRLREERRRRDEADYAPSIVLPSVYDRPEPAVTPSTYTAPVDRPDDGMRGGGFTTGGSFGGESFSTGYDSSSSSSDSSSSSSSSD